MQKRTYVKWYVVRPRSKTSDWTIGLGRHSHLRRYETFLSRRSAIQILIMDWRVIPRRLASRSRDWINKSTLTRRCSCAGLRTFDVSRSAVLSSPSSNLRSKSLALPDDGSLHHAGAGEAGAHEDHPLRLLAVIPVASGRGVDLPEGQIRMLEV